MCIHTAMDTYPSTRNHGYTFVYVSLKISMDTRMENYEPPHGYGLREYRLDVWVNVLPI